MLQPSVMSWTFQASIGTPSAIKQHIFWRRLATSIRWRQDPIKPQNPQKMYWKIKPCTQTFQSPWSNHENAAMTQTPSQNPHNSKSSAAIRQEAKEVKIKKFPDSSKTASWSFSETFREGPSCLLGRNRGTNASPVACLFHSHRSPLIILPCHAIPLTCRFEFPWQVTRLLVHHCRRFTHLLLYCDSPAKVKPAQVGRANKKNTKIWKRSKPMNQECGS